MPSHSENPEICLCASVLAKAYKVDPNASANLHDALGEKFSSDELRQIEELTHDYFALSLTVLERKISWLRGHIDSPIDIDAVFSTQANGVVNTPITNNNVGIMQICESVQQNDTDALKKKKNKGKKKKPTEEVENSDTVKDSEKLESQTETVEISTIEADLGAQKVAESLSAKQKKKKKKKKKKNKSVQKENNTQPEEKEDTPVVTAETDQNCKSPEEAAMLDSGIGSSATSGGEDKSSVLSGGTVESVGENTEIGTVPMCSYEVGGNSIIEFLKKSENVIFEESERKHEGKTGAFGDGGKTIMSFGSLNLADSTTNNQNHKKVNDNKSRKKRANTRGSCANKAVAKKPGPDNIGTIISFMASNNETTVQKKHMISMPKFKDVEVKGDYDHSGAVRFMIEEWNRTMSNPKMQWYSSP